MYGDIDLTAHPDLISDGLAPDKVMIRPADDANQRIGVSLINSCCNDIWGNGVADAIRDFLVEFVRNAFEHSDASQVGIELQTSAIVIIDDGARFDIAELAANPEGRGGQLAYMALLRELRIHAITSRPTEHGNCTHLPLVRNPRELIRVSPCAVEVRRETLRDRRVEYTSVSGCNTIYLVAPDYLSYSDIPLLYRLVLDCAGQARRSVVVVLSKASEGVLAHAAYVLQGIKVVAW